LFNWAPLETTHQFVGLKNYETMLGDPLFWKAVRNTFTIFLASTIPGIAISMLLAVVLSNRSLRAKNFWRMVLLVPNVTPVVTVTLVFGSIFGQQYGPIASVLQFLHVPSVNWAGSAVAAQFVIAIMIIWRWSGYNALIYLAAIQAVPDSLYESSELDGAGRWRTFVSVTLPMIRPTILFSVVTSTIGGLQIFTEPLLFTTPQGGANNQALTMTLLVYGQAFNSFKFGYASAIAVALLVVVLVLAAVNFAVTRLIRSA
ncbi:MAG: Cellobiose transporter rane protein, partial [Frondihabitans sp.]|nr:Cellobiose transporter rane protein [Frondihabitans sp.]